MAFCKVMVRVRVVMEFAAFAAAAITIGQFFGLL